MEATCPGHDMIVDELSKIRDNVKNHVRSYYHSDVVSAREIDMEALQNIAHDVGHVASQLSRLLLGPSTRYDAIRLVVCCTILTKCDEEHDKSLLP
jgi:hypothetical protein